MANVGYNWPDHFNIGVLKVPHLDTPNAVKKITQVLAEDTGMKIHLAYSSDNSKATYFKWLKYGIVDMIDGGELRLKRMLEGKYQHADRDTGPFPLRIVWIMSKYDSGFIVRGDSKIKSIYDIKPGVRVVDMRGFLTSQTNIEGLLAWAGIKDLEKDVRWVKAKNTEDKARLIVDGEADVAFSEPTGPVIERAENNPYGIRWIELNADKDPEGAKRFHEKCRLIDFGLMFRGVPSARGRWGMNGMDQFCSNANTDPDFFYHLTKWLDENWRRFKDLHPWLNQTTRENLMQKLDVTFLPCHAGLIKYLKEIKLWTPEHEKRNKQNIDLVNRYCEASLKAMRLADDKQIMVSRDNPEWVNLWENYKTELGLPPFNYSPSLGKGRKA